MDVAAYLGRGRARAARDGGHRAAGLDAGAGVWSSVDDLAAGSPPSCWRPRSSPPEYAGRGHQRAVPRPGRRRPGPGQLRPQPVGPRRSSSKGAKVAALDRAAGLAPHVRPLRRRRDLPVGRPRRPAWPASCSPTASSATGRRPAVGRRSRRGGARRGRRRPGLSVGQKRAASRSAGAGRDGRDQAVDLRQDLVAVEPGGHHLLAPGSRRRRSPSASEPRRGLGRAGQQPAAGHDAAQPQVGRGAGQGVDRGRRGRCARASRWRRAARTARRRAGRR